MGSASHAVHINGLCASRMMGQARAFAAAADAVAARPDAVVSVVRYRDGSINHETVAVVSRGAAAPVDAAPVDAAPVDAAPVDAAPLPHAAAYVAKRRRNHANATNHATATMQPTTQSIAYRVETYCGTVDGWRAASPAVVDAATAARRLRLYRAVRGDVRLYRVAAA